MMSYRAMRNGALGWHTVEASRDELHEYRHRSLREFAHCLHWSLRCRPLTQSRTRPDAWLDNCGNVALGNNSIPTPSFLWTKQISFQLANWIKHLIGYNDPCIQRKLAIQTDRSPTHWTRTDWASLPTSIAIPTGSQPSVWNRKTSLMNSAIWLHLLLLGTMHLLYLDNPSHCTSYISIYKRGKSFTKC
jgi:hypothetical protein